MNTGDVHTSGFLFVEQGEHRRALTADVAVALPFARPLTYLVPDDMKETLALGHRVEVPLGKRGRPVEGFVVSIDDRPWDSTLRRIGRLVDDVSFLRNDLIDVGREMAAHYACSLGVALAAMVPAPVRRGAGQRKVRIAAITPEAPDDPSIRMGPKQRQVLACLRRVNEPVTVERLLSEADASSATLRGLVDKGWVDVRQQVVEDIPDVNEVDEPVFGLNDEQRSALGQIEARLDEKAFSVTLLHGVSGSGKTEVYIAAMRRVLAAGRQAILLVPEIVLTTQLVERLSRRFPCVALNHSGMTDAERSRAWRHVASGRAPVVIGTRSAVFAPCPDLGLIVVDEEHEPSYKNLKAPRFHVRDVAVARARTLGVPIVLGSATPSIELWHRCTQRDDHHLVPIRHRVRGLPMPRVSVVDMRDEQAEAGRALVISRTLESALKETLDAGEQAMILINRRGFAQRLVCQACGTRVECPHCQAGFVVHTSDGSARCHHCRTRIVAPKVCPDPSCGAPLVWSGAGTQRVEDVVEVIAPNARVARVDSDTMTRGDDYRALVESFGRRDLDVIVGTQMIAKGLDFPFVSLVGVINAEPTALDSDFRAQERLFQLITQVAGRAGRSDTPGRVVIQTSTPDLPALRFALSYDYEAFVESELASRRRLAWPPFSRIARIVLTHERESAARDEAGKLRDGVDACIRKLAEEGGADAGAAPLYDCLGPTPCAIRRMRNRYRYEVLVRSGTVAGLRALLRTLARDGVLRTRARAVVVDVDPVSML